MKKLLQLTCIGYFLFGFQIEIKAQKVIDISSLETDTYSITTLEEETAFLTIAPELNITEVKGLNAANKLMPFNDNDGKYALSDFQAQENAIKIHLFQGETELKVITIEIVTAEQKPAVAAGGGNSPCSELDKKKNFGIDRNSLLKNEVVYVYDFNKDLSKRFLYRITDRNDAEKVDLAKETLRPRNQVYVKIAGLNHFLYQGTIDETFTFLDSEPSALFKKIIMGDGVSFDKLFTAKGAGAQNSAELDNFEQLLKEFQEQYQQLQIEVLKAYDPCSCFPNCANKIDLSKILSTATKIRIGVKQLKILKGKKEEKKTEKQACLKIHEDIAQLMKDKGDAKIIAAKQAELKAKCNDDVKDKLENELKEVNGEILQVDKFLDAKIEDLLPSDTDLKNLAVFAMNVVSQNQSTWKGPIQLEGNVFNVTLKMETIESVIKNFGMGPDKTTLNYKIPILWTPFVSFSTGSFVGVGKYLQNKKYKWQQIAPGASSYTLVESGYTNVPLGFAALGHVEWTAWRNVGVGVSIGAGATIEENPRISYLLGGSFFVGNLKQLAITAGIVGMHVDTISATSKYLYDNQVINSSSSTIDYDKQFKTGPFISLSYILFNSKP